MNAGVLTVLTTINPAIAVDGVNSLLVHPATQLFPSITSGPEFETLVDDIRVNGLHNPIVRTLRGAILDGRRRALACRRTGVTPKYQLHTGNPWRYVLTVNSHRFSGNNHRALVGGAIANETGANLSARTLIGLTGVSSMGSLLRGKAVARLGIDRLKTLTAEGLVPLTTGARIAHLPDDAQHQFCARIEAGGHPRFVGRPGWTGEDTPPDPTKPVSQREARYRYVQESALQVIANSFEGLGIVLAAAEGLDPAITAEQAAHWKRDLSRQSKSFRRLMALLSERGAGQGA